MLKLIIYIKLSDIIIQFKSHSSPFSIVHISCGTLTHIKIEYVVNWRIRMSKTKIVIIQLKEIIYTAIFVGLGILLILLLIFMFSPKRKDSNNINESRKYTAGVYNSKLTLNNAALNLEVVVDETDIKSIRFINLEESVTTMYPLIQPALEEISTQLYNDVDIQDVTISEDSQYTQTMLLETISSTLEKAAPTK